MQPMTPAEVRKLRPTEVASILGLDRQVTIVPVAMPDNEIIDLQADAMTPATLIPAPTGEQRLRRVVFD